MDKIVLVEEKVDDLYGLYMDLRKSEFLVKNVGSDPKGTYVYLDESEAKDPVAKVKDWIGKEAPVPSLSLRKKRVKEYEGLLAVEREREEKRLEEERKKAEEEAAISGKPLDPVVPEPKDPFATGTSPVAFEDSEGNVIGELLEGQPSPAKEPLWKRLWKKFF